MSQGFNFITITEAMEQELNFQQTAQMTMSGTF